MLYNELIKVLKPVHDVTFYINDIPIVSVHLSHGEDIYIVTNNMIEMNCFHFTYSEELEDSIYSMIKTELGELLRKNDKISFKSLLHEGIIDREKVQVEQIEIYYDQKEHEDKTTWVTYTFENSVNVETVIDIITAFIDKFFVE